MTHPIPIRLTRQQLEWLAQQTRGGSISRAGAIRLCVQNAMESRLALVTQTPDPEQQAPQALPRA
jgi:hypothetical protein